ncbi:uncharacterized protein BJX67DRAFT_240267 [Aspergillus lucknowensis]|uniref:Uncharacterized protein n=1 Tax=Aspergillus lucknowensis TaxID=176173 RepID=A0ABR4LGH5_9EURO
MLRFPPTRIALTDDDICYHLDSIFAQNTQLAKWHRKDTGSSGSYEGDDDDGLFLNSDTLSLPDTPVESDCDESRSQTLTDGSPRENRAEERETDSEPCSAVWFERTQAHLLWHETLSIKSANSPPRVAQLGIPSGTDWRLLWQLFTSQHNIPIPRSLACPIAAFSRLSHVELDAAPEGLSLFATASSLRLFYCKATRSYLGIIHKTSSSSTTPRYPSCISLGVEVSPRIKSLQIPSSSLPEILLFPLKPPLPTRMDRTHDEISVSLDWVPDELGTSEINALVEISRNSSDGAQQPSFPQADAPHSVRGRSDSPSNRESIALGGLACSQTNDTKLVEGTRDESMKSVDHLALRNTFSRGTQTDPDLATPMEATKGAADNLLERHPLQQENIAPGSVGPQPPPQLPWQDPFISAMFPEPNPPAYDPTSHIRRGVQGHINPPARRGRAARAPEGALGQLVHPGLVDAAVFQEYVHQLIAELDRAP